ncbi:MAG: thioredoxin family protein [Flavobacterium sp.]|nr:MAG: thioredoxin family protein [Flavobacterium sp.]
MNRKLLILLFFLVTFLAKSQSLVWTTDMTDAIAMSNEKRKPMLLYFTGPGVSENLQNEVFKSPEFEKWSRNNVILVRLDLSDSSSNEIKEQNNKLRTAFGVVELPQVCFASATIRKGKTMFDTLGKVSYVPGGAQAWITESDMILNPQ